MGDARESRADRQVDAGRDSSSGALRELQREIETHRQHDRSQSYLGKMFAGFNGGYGRSLTELEQLERDMQSARKEGDKEKLERLEKQVAEAVKADREAIAWQDEVSHYGGGFLKTASLFARGRLGFGGIIAAHALDRARPADSFKDQVADLALGGATGGLMKGAFHILGQKPVGIAAKGVGLGLTARTLEIGLNRQTYLDTATGTYSLSDGLSNLRSGVLDKKALAADVVIFGLSHGMVKGANRLTGDAVARSPFFSTVLTGTSFGLSGGATGEIMRQQDAGEGFDFGKVAKRALIQGAFDTLAAAPGGMQADRHLRTRISDYSQRKVGDLTAGIKQDVAYFRTQAGESLRNFLDLTYMTIAGPQPQLAFAFATEAPRPARSLAIHRPTASDHILMMQGNGNGSGGAVTPEKISQELSRLGRKPLMERIERLGELQEDMAGLESKPVRTEEQARSLFEMDRRFKEHMRAVREEANRLKAEINEIEQAGREAPEAKMDRYFDTQQLVEDVIGHRLRTRFGWDGKTLGAHDRTVSIKDGIGWQTMAFNGMSDVLNAGLRSHQEVARILSSSGWPIDRAHRWVGLAIPAETAADMAGVDYMPVNRGTGELYPFDSTMKTFNMRPGEIVSTRLVNKDLMWDSGQKRVPAERADWLLGVVNDVEFENMIYRASRDRHMSSLDARREVVLPIMRSQLAEILGQTIARKSPFNLIDTQVPSSNPRMDVSRALYELWRFKADLQELGMYEWAGALRGSMGYLVNARGADALPWKGLVFSNGVERSLNGRVLTLRLSEGSPRNDNGSGNGNGRANGEAPLERFRPRKAASDGGGDKSGR